jgi:tRNA(Ile)-lysidine synthase TilS/MesJ
MEKMVLETINRVWICWLPVTVSWWQFPEGLILCACYICFVQLRHKTLGITLHVVTYKPRVAAGSCRQKHVSSKKWALRLGLPVTVCRVDVESCIRAGGYSKQDAARRVRYASLRSVAARIGANRLAVAHHLDDRAETILFVSLSAAAWTGWPGFL